MEKNLRLALTWAVLFMLLAPTGVFAGPAEEPGPADRCPVCGMSVAKYSGWFTQIRHADGTVKWFDGVKDMLAYYFQPERFGAPKNSMEEIWVKDYYTQAWMAGKQAYYVTGSSVQGPMGHELVPLVSRESAESFQNDHGGDRIWKFEEITPGKVAELRAGHRMKKGRHTGHGEGDHHGSHEGSSPGNGHGHMQNQGRETGGESHGSQSGGNNRQGHQEHRH